MNISKSTHVTYTLTLTDGEYRQLKGFLGRFTRGRPTREQFIGMDVSHICDSQWEDDMEALYNLAQDMAMYEITGKDWREK